MTSGGDAQRSSWIRSDGKISPKSLEKPGFSLVWKMKLADGSRPMSGLTTPALMDFYIGYRGFRTLSFFGANSNKIVAVDSDLARVEWEDKYSSPTPQSASGCSGGLTSAVTRPTNVSYPSVMGGAFGRGTPAKSGVGAPHEGSVVLSALATRRSAPPPAPSAAKKMGRPEPNPFAPHIQYVLALSADGKLHSIWVSNGNEASPAVDFVPANAHAFGLIAYDDTAYVATAGDCGGAGNGVWSLNLTSKKVNHWSTTKPIAGTMGPAAGPDGTQYIGAGDELVALSPGQLESVAIHKISGTEFSSSPVVFEYHGRNLLAIASRDGRLNLLDTSELNNPKELDRTAPFTDKDSPIGALASWQDLAGGRWVLAPSRTTIVAWKIVDKDGTPAFERGWTSRDLIAPLPPVVVNGVVFALSSGEFAPGDRRTSSAERLQKSKPAVLYAMDGLSGRELWNSGSTVHSFVNNGGLAAGGTRVYVSTQDGTQYAFGFPIEH
jgi:outer membrane protein assembly factor BamB